MLSFSLVAVGANAKYSAIKKVSKCFILGDSQMYWSWGKILFFTFFACSLGKTLQLVLLVSFARLITNKVCKTCSFLGIKLLFCHSSNIVVYISLLFGVSFSHLGIGLEGLWHLKLLCSTAWGIMTMNPSAMNVSNLRTRTQRTQWNTCIIWSVVLRSETKHGTQSKWL